MFSTGDVEKRIKKQFIFISYAHGDYKNKVKMLVDRLREDGANIVFDEGGLDAGDNIQEFQQLILHDNCKKVFIIFDKKYKNRIDTVNSGVYQEYKLIANNYVFNPNKYVPVIADDDKNVTPLFLPQVYMKLDDYDLILKSSGKRCTTKTLDKSEVALRVRSCAESYDAKDYKAAKKDLNVIFSNKCAVDTEICVLAHAYSLDICIDIVTDGAIKNDSLSKLVHLIEEKKISEDNNIPNYSVNCSLLYKREQKYDKAIELAELAYESANNSKFPNLYYYSCNLADMYYAYERYSKAHDIIKRALAEYENYIRLENHMEDAITVKDICISYCKIALALSEQSKKNRNRRGEYADEAKRVVKRLLDIENLDIWDDDVLHEIYETMENVFGLLKKIYE